MLTTGYRWQICLPLRTRLVRVLCKIPGILAPPLLWGSFGERPGSLLFCPDCGTLLDLPLGDEANVRCDQCGHLEPASCVSHLKPPHLRLTSDFCTAYENSKITTYSHPDAFPSSLRQKRKTRTKVHEGSDALLKVTTCNLFRAEFTNILRLPGH